MIDTYRKLIDSGNPADVALRESYAITYFGTICARLEAADERIAELKRIVDAEDICDRRDLVVAQKTEKSLRAEIEKREKVDEGWGSWIEENKVAKRDLDDGAWCEVIEIEDLRTRLVSLSPSVLVSRNNIPKVEMSDEE